MANNVVLTNIDYTYPGKLSEQVLIDPAINAPDIQSLFTVRTGIAYKEQLNTAAQLGKILKGGQGCNSVVTGDPVNITNRTLETCEWEFYLEQCADVFNSTILGEVARMGFDRWNLVGNQLGKVIESLVSDSLHSDLFRTLSFGDTSSGDPYYNACDGLWTVLFAGAASYEVTAVNDNITTLSASDTAGYLLALFEGADILLKQLPANQKAFYVTGNVYEKLMQHYEDVAADGGFTQREENGVLQLRYRGIPVIHFYAWDNWIDVDNLGTNVRILYTTPANHVIGLEDGATSAFDFWYDKADKYNKIRGSFKLGYNYVHNKLQAISYGNI